MKEPFDPTRPIENLYEQIENAVEFSEARDALYTDMQVITIAYSLIFAQGIYKTACREWTKKAAVEKIWPNLKSHFPKTQRDL